MIDAAARPFWGSVIDPIVTAGYLPPVADGFARFYASPAAREGASRTLAETLKNPKTSAYDTHPPLKLRLERIEEMQTVNEDGAYHSPALALLDDVPTLERQLLAAIAPNVNFQGLKPTDWDSAAQTVWLPIWRKRVAEQAKLLEGLTIGALPELLRNLSQIGAQIPDPPGRLLSREQRSERAYSLMWMALGLRLEEHGWEIHMQPGEFFFNKGEERIAPPDELMSLRQGKTSPAEWSAWCARTGLGEVRLTALSQQIGKPSIEDGRLTARV